MAEILEALTPRQRSLLQNWAGELQMVPGWGGNLPVAILERCWLRLRRVPIEQLALALPPDASADAPELVRYRTWIAAGEPAWSAQLRCWQEFGQPACQEAQRHFWNHQDRGNHGWTLDRYLAFLAEYRRWMEADGHKPIPLVVLARTGAPEPHRIEWCWPSPTPMRHTGS